MYTFIFAAIVAILIFVSPLFVRVRALVKVKLDPIKAKFIPLKAKFTPK